MGGINFNIMEKKKKRNRKEMSEVVGNIEQGGV